MACLSCGPGATRWPASIAATAAEAAAGTGTGDGKAVIHRRTCAAATGRDKNPLRAAAKKNSPSACTVSTQRPRAAKRSDPGAASRRGSPARAVQTRTSLSNMPNGRRLIAPGNARAAPRRRDRRGRGANPRAGLRRRRRRFQGERPGDALLQSPLLFRREALGVVRRGFRHEARDRPAAMRYV